MELKEEILKWGERIEEITGPEIMVSWGKKYAKVSHKTQFAHMAYGFVEIATGNIYYPKSWDAPQLNYVRGNILDGHKGMLWCGEWGIKTIR